MRKSRAFGFCMILLVYLVAAAAGFAIYRFAPGANVWRVFLADIGATVVTFIGSLIFRNASVYDPYWSVAPPVILLAYAITYGSWTFGTVLLLFVIFFWGVRLTGNWAYTFKNLEHQDWRYTMLHEKSGKLYPIVNLFGIHMFPTLVVYLAILPALVYLETPVWNVLTAVGAIVCIAATLLEMFADIQMQRFRRRAAAGEMITTGLWKNARHPNYLGEILMWWGVYLMLLSCGGAWYYGAGALVNTLMFLFISIPMAEKRLLARKPDYAQHIRRTHILLPFPGKREEEPKETRAL